MNIALPAEDGRVEQEKEQEALRIFQRWLHDWSEETKGGRGYRLLQHPNGRESISVGQSTDPRCPRFVMSIDGGPDSAYESMRFHEVSAEEGSDRCRHQLVENVRFVNQVLLLNRELTVSEPAQKPQRPAVAVEKVRVGLIKGWLGRLGAGLRQ